jgi:Ca-activated chloride channel family protein
LQAAQLNKALVESLLQETAPPANEDAGQNAAGESDETTRDAQAGAATQDPPPPGETPPEAQDPSANGEPHQSDDSQDGHSDVPGSELDDERTTTPPIRGSAAGFDDERRQALEQWLRKIPDDPGELLRRKFWYEQQQHQDQGKTR